VSEHHYKNNPSDWGNGRHPEEIPNTEFSHTPPLFQQNSYQQNMNNLYNGVVAHSKDLEIIPNPDQIRIDRINEHIDRLLNQDILTAEDITDLGNLQEIRERFNGSPGIVAAFRRMR
jgi:hypothetical protein